MNLIENYVTYTTLTNVPEAPFYLHNSLFNLMILYYYVKFTLRRIRYVYLI